MQIILEKQEPMETVIPAKTARENEVVKALLASAGTRTGSAARAQRRTPSENTLLNLATRARRVGGWESLTDIPPPS